MTAQEAREITGKSLEEIKKMNIFLAESFREAADEKIKEAAEKGESKCALKLCKRINDDILNNILCLFQKDGFSSYKEADTVVVKW